MLQVRFKKTAFYIQTFSEWGGKMCNVEIPNTNNRKYGKNVELLSSGKPEWIENLRKHSMRERKPSSSASMMSGESLILFTNNYFYRHEWFFKLHRTG